MWLKNHIDAFRKASALLKLFINKGDIKLRFSLCLPGYRVIFPNKLIQFSLIEFECREYQRSIWSTKY